MSSSTRCSSKISPPRDVASWASLAAERVGAVEDLAQRHAQVQGQRQGAIRVRACRLGDDPALPAMRGELVLCTGGLGFVPGGLDEDHQLATGLGQVFGGVLGAVIQDLGRAAQPVPNLRRARLPVPLLAAISDHARFWVPDPTYRLHWRPDGGELWQGIACSAPTRCSTRRRRSPRGPRRRRVRRRRRRRRAAFR
ncbi:MAG: hypothetical protein R3B06_06340 [Kofleriaceae bacterium]